MATAQKEAWLKRKTAANSVTVPAPVPVEYKQEEVAPPVPPASEPVVEAPKMAEVETPKADFNLPDGVRLLTGLEKVTTFLGCHDHKWGLPIRLEGHEYPEPYTAQRSCLECAATQFYDMKTFTGGPLFRREVQNGNGTNGNGTKIESTNGAEAAIERSNQDSGQTS
jgi:hypothetical protein